MKIKPASLTSILIFSLIFVTGLDILAYLIDKEYTITYQLQYYFGGSAYSMRSSLFGFIMGGLLVHVTQWGKREETVKKPWGYYTDIYRSNDVVFKEIVVFPKEAISLQRHLLRSEFWYVTQGSGFLENGNEKCVVKEGSSINIPAQNIHRITNNGDEPLIIKELQYGNCDEHDIIRLEDKYGR